MLLKFCARSDLLVNDPDMPARTGQLLRRVNRKFVLGKDGKPHSLPALPTPHEVDSESPAGQRLVKQCRRAALWAFDEETAKYCDVKFVPVEFKDGEWVERSAAKSPVAPVVSKKDSK